MIFFNCTIKNPFYMLFLLLFCQHYYIILFIIISKIIFLPEKIEKVLFFNIKDFSFKAMIILIFFYAVNSQPFRSEKVYTFGKFSPEKVLIYGCFSPEKMLIY